MDLFGDVSVIGTPLKIFAVDLLLSGDNAVVIALACRSLPPRHARNAAILGTVAAILLRVFLTTVATLIMQVAMIKLLGALALLVIAVKLLLTEDHDEHSPIQARNDLFSAIAVIVIADLVMSIDNVVAVAAAAQGDVGYLLLGLALSIPLLIYGSLVIARYLNTHPILVQAGGALLGWLAGDIAVSDPLIAEWMNSQAFGLQALAPPLLAGFVVLHARIMRQERRMRPGDVAAISTETPITPMAASVPVVEPEPEPVAETLSAEEEINSQKTINGVLMLILVGVPVLFVASLIAGIIYIINAARQF